LGNDRRSRRRRLNFSGFRFNAPSHRNDRAIVGKVDYHIDTRQANGEHSRHAGRQYGRSDPGAVSRTATGFDLRTNSKGISAQYTAIVRPNLINVFNSDTRASGRHSPASPGPLVSDRARPLQNPYARPMGQRLPTLNPTEDLTWIKGQTHHYDGREPALIHNNIASDANSFAR